MSRIFINGRIMHEGASGVYRDIPSEGHIGGCLSAAVYLTVFLFAITGAVWVYQNWTPMLTALRATLAAFGIIL